MAAFDAALIRAAIIDRAIGTSTNGLGNNITIGTVLAAIATTHEDDEQADLALVKPRFRAELLSMTPRPAVSGSISGATRFSDVTVKGTLTHAVKGVDLDDETTRNALLDAAGTMAQDITRALETEGTTSMRSAGIVGGRLKSRGWKRSRLDQNLLEHVLDLYGVIEENGAGGFSMERVTTPMIRTAATPITGGPTWGWSAPIATGFYVEFQLDPYIDRTQDLEIEIAWSPVSTEAAKTISWRAQIGAEQLGSSVATVTTTIDAADEVVPATLALYARTTITIPASVVTTTTIDELHIRIARITASADPITDVALHGIECTQQVTR